MKNRKWIRKGISALLALSMVLSLVPLPAFAATTDNLCEHHTEHTAECGYVEAAEGSPCTHIHDEACGYAEPIGEVLCACTETDDTGALVHTEGCGYVAPVAGSDCTHAHDDACGYAEAVEAHECHYECAECAAAAASEEAPEESSEPAPVCDCGTDDPAIHATTCAVYVAPENPVCSCAEACGVETQNFWCDVCGFDYAKCTGTDTAVVYADEDYTYDEATKTYTVYTADGLFAVAELVNGDAYSANITLAADIVLNENLADQVTVAEDGTVSAHDSVRKWTPMGENSPGEYQGTFDGGNHTITGLYCVYNGYSNTGLISNLAEGATVKNVKIHDFCLESSGGAVVGYNRGEVIGCSISGTGILGWTTNYQYVGGVVGFNGGTVKDCTSSAALTFRGMGYFGGIVGQNTTSQATVIGCSNSGTITAAGYSEMKVGGITGDDMGTVKDCYNTGSIRAAAEDGSVQVGGIVGYTNGTVSGCYNTGNISGEAMAESAETYVGGIAGSTHGTVSGCYNTAAVSGDATFEGTGAYVGGIAGFVQNTVSGCHNTGTISVTANAYSSACVGGIAASLNGTASNCYNSGSLVGDGRENCYVGGIAGECYSGGASNCYNIGSVDSGSYSYSGGIIAAAYGTFADCYYLDTCVKSGSPEYSSADGITAKTEAQFASGEVAYLLNGDQSTITFKQTLLTDAYPGFTGGTVYRVSVTCTENAVVYANSQDTLTHNYVNNTCTACGEVCDHSGSTHTSATDLGDGTHGYDCTVCGAAVTEEHTGGTATCTTLAVCEACGASYGELAAHTPDINGKCTVDGCGYQYAAKVGDTFYETIHKALRAAEGINGCTLTLLDDVTLTSMSSYASYVNTGTFTLDLNGKTLSSNKSTLEVMGSADLTIRDSIGGGKIVSTDSSAVYLSGGKLTIESGTFEGTLDGVFLSGTSTLIVKGGTFTGSRAMITGFGSNVEIDLTNIDPAGLTLKNNGSGTFAPKLPEGYGMVGSDGKLLTSLSAEQSATVHKHEYKYTDLGDGNHQQVCSCGLTTGEPAAHSTTAEDDKAATCVAPAYCSVCDSEYGDLDKTNHDSSVECENGFCPNGCYEPATLNPEGYYEIDNAGKLFWFAQQVNVEGNREIKGILTADIDLEERPWTPIGSTGETNNNFRGVFDGQNYTITGLYVEGDRAGLGFFGEVRTGTVKNFTIYGEVVVNTEVNYVGGVIGSICGVNGETDLERNGAIIQNITSYVNLTAKAHGVGMIGGFVGYANHQSLIENCSWYGTFDAGIYRVDSGAGGFVGRIYDTATVTIRNCGAYGDIITAYKSGTYNNQATIYIGGFLSYSPSGANTVLEYNLWAGRIINNTDLTAANAHLSAYGTMNSSASKTNCYALEGTPYVTTNDENAGGITTVTAEQLKSGEIAYLLQGEQTEQVWGQNIGTDAYPVLGGDTVYQVKNCNQKIAYSNSTADIGHNYVNGICTVCGEACGHTGGTATCTTLAVCAICGVSYGELSTTNHDSSVECENGFCPNGCYEPAGLAGSYYQITNAGQLYWFAAQVNSGKTNINGELKANIVINDGVLAEMIRLTPDPSRFRLWTPIGTEDNAYSGDFCGYEHTVSGLYFNDSTAGCVGLFGYVGSGGVNHLGVIDSYFNGSGAVGGVVGHNEGTVEYAYSNSYVGGNVCIGGVVGDNRGTVMYAYNLGSISGLSEVGGVTGTNYNTVKNCYNIVSISGDFLFGDVVGDNIGTLENCYYPADAETDELDGTTAKTWAQFKSGEVAYLLGRPFGQNIGTNSLPVLYGETVYYGYTSCADAEKVYTNDPKASTEKPEHTGEASYTPTEDGAQHIAAYACCGSQVTEDHTYENGFCLCGLYDLWVAGEQISDSHLTVSGSTGTATYDPATDTLTLNGFDNDFKSYSFTNNGSPIHAAVYTMSDLNVVLVGENCLGADGFGFIMGIWSDAALTIGGDGAILSCPLYSANGTIINGGTLDILGVDVAFDGPSTTINGGSVNVYVNTAVTYGTLTVNGGRVVLENSSFNLGYGVGYGSTTTIVIGEGMAVYDANGDLIENPDFKNLEYVLIQAPCDHTQATPSYTWTEDPITLTVTVSCTACGETFTGSTTDMDVTISDDGFTTIYTASATLNGKTYTASKTVSNQVTSVNITWGEMEFTYTDGEWQPESHTYAEGEWTPDNGSNWITVKNNGTVAANVTFAYEKATGMEAINGEFTIDGTNKITQVALPVNDEKKIYLLLTGKPNETNGYVTLGTITVTITTGGE